MSIKFCRFLHCQGNAKNNKEIDNIVNNLSKSKNIENIEIVNYYEELRLIYILEQSKDIDPKIKKMWRIIKNELI